MGPRQTGSDPVLDGLSQGCILTYVSITPWQTGLDLDPDGLSQIGLCTYVRKYYGLVLLSFPP